MKQMKRVLFHPSSDRVVPADLPARKNGYIERMIESVVIKSSAGPGYLELHRAASNEPFQYFTATMSVDGLTAITPQIDAEWPGPENLVALFETMAKNWKGWEGVEEWETFERDLRLYCVSDRTGHVRMTVELRRGNDFRNLRRDNEPEWEAKGTLTLEVGSLEGIAKSLAAFFGSIDEQ